MIYNKLILPKKNSNFLGFSTLAVFEGSSLLNKLVACYKRVLLPRRLGDHASCMYFIITGRVTKRIIGCVGGVK